MKYNTTTKCLKSWNSQMETIIFLIEKTHTLKNLKSKQSTSINSSNKITVWKFSVIVPKSRKIINYHGSVWKMSICIKMIQVSNNRKNTIEIVRYSGEKRKSFFKKLQNSEKSRTHRSPQFRRWWLDKPSLVHDLLVGLEYLHNEAGTGTSSEK